MAETALTMSLDDLIQNSKSKKPSGRGGKGGAKDSGLGVKKAGVAKGGRGGGRGGFKVGGRGGGPRPPKVDLDNATKWEHDMYQGPTRRGGGGGRAGPASRDFTLYISNLDYNVTNADLKELFSDYPSVKKSSLKFDRSGRSEGTAIVVFGNGDEARSAKRRYTKMYLDGKIMQLELIEGAAGSVKQLSSGITLTKGGGGGGGPAGPGRALKQALSGVENGSGKRGRRRRGRGGRHGGGAAMDMED